VARRDWIEPLYAAFARYPRFEGHVPCTHCVSEAEQDRLRPVPLRAAGADLLAPVAANAGVGTFGGAADDKHFLPRLCELRLEGAFVDALLFAGLRTCAFDGWPAAERAAVTGYLRAGLAEAVDAQDDANPPDTVRALEDQADRFPTAAALADAVRALPDPSFARCVGALAWCHDALRDAPRALWAALATGDTARRLLPLLDGRPSHDDLAPAITEALARLPPTGTPRA
jgi:hypothetical protein